jgi:ribosome recycling factor
MTEEEKKKKIKKVFAEMKSGKSKIKNPKQAIAIALNSKKKDKKKDKKKPMKKGTKNA